MKTFVLTGAGLSSATVLGLVAWVFRVCLEAPTNAGHPAHLLWGIDEYWNGGYPEGEQPW